MDLCLDRPRKWILTLRNIRGLDYRPTRRERETNCENSQGVRGEIFGGFKEVTKTEVSETDREELYGVSSGFPLFRDDY
ncbi:hypothetical protein F1880_005877 [Penicillium rolfsii]|nr:hypothetical protein F1880_005877 [Penicillium rolfsii]